MGGGQHGQMGMNPSATDTHSGWRHTAAHLCHSHLQSAMSCSCITYITSVGLGPTWPGCTAKSTEQTMFLYDVSSTFSQFSSTWWASYNASLSAHQCGHLHCHCNPFFPTSTASTVTPAPAQLMAPPLVALSCPSILHNCQEEVLGNCLLQSLIESDPGEHQVWPLDSRSLVCSSRPPVGQPAVLHCCLSSVGVHSTWTRLCLSPGCPSAWLMAPPW